jgi:hypothetical protein
MVHFRFTCAFSSEIGLAIIRLRGHYTDIHRPNAGLRKGVVHGPVGSEIRSGSDRECHSDTTALDLSVIVSNPDWISAYSTYQASAERDR